MFIIKHSVETDYGAVIWDESLPGAYVEKSECMPAIEVMLNEFDDSGYDAEHDRWWARKDNSPYDIHYWWAASVEN